MTCDHVYACPDCDQRFHDLTKERDELRVALRDAEASGWRQGMAEAHDSEMGREIELLAQRALDAEQGRDRAVAQELRLRVALTKIAAVTRLAELTLVSTSARPSDE